MLRHFVSAAAALVLAACSSSTLPTEEWVRAEATGNATLAITNRGDDPVYVRVSDPTELGIMIGCSPSTCAPIAPGATVRVPYAQIQFYDAGDEQAAVNWWVFTADGATRDTGTLLADL
jgi:hypothetical protein